MPSVLLRALVPKLLVGLRRIVDVETLLLVGGNPDGMPPASGVREARPDEVEALLELYGPRRLRLRRRLQRSFARGDVCLVAEGPDGIRGCAWLARSPLRLPRYRLRVSPRPGQVYVHGVHVRTDARKQGLGTALALAAREHAAARGDTCVLGHISPRNPATPHLFLERLGDEVFASVSVAVLLDRFGLPLRHRPVPSR